MFDYTLLQEGGTVGKFKKDRPLAHLEKGMTIAYTNEAGENLFFTVLGMSLAVNARQPGSEQHQEVFLHVKRVVRP
ncbi:hypothetical protein CBA19CS91_15645 [Paraburkholderia hospita]|nr:hypothetical protein CBA19CS91_15645 [Paraburkholderia hospita]